MSAADIRQKKLFYRKNSYLTLVVVLAIVVFANLIFQRIFFRLDLTKGKIYSISKATKDILKELENPMTIKVFVSKDLPSPYNKSAKYLRDLLAEYRTFSHHKIDVEFIDPKEKREYTQLAREMGITPVRVNVVKNDRFELVEGYLGMAIIYGNKKEVVPVITRISDLEYIVTSKIVKLLSKKQKKVGFLKGHDEIDFFTEDMKRRLQVLKDQYILQDVILKDKSILDDNDILVIAGPREDFSDTELYYIDQYILPGKPVIFLLDAFDISFKTFTATPVKTRLFDHLRHYGVDIDTASLIADLQNEQITVSTQQGLFTIQNFLYYPYFLKVTNFNREHPVVKSFTLLPIAYVSPIEFKGNVGKDTEAGSVKFIPLMYSSKNAWAERTRNVNPYLRLNPPPHSRWQQFVIAAEVRGPLSSYFTEANALDRESFVARGQNARFIVMSTSQILAERFISERNLKLFFNMIDYLVQDQRLIEIRSKGIQYSLLKPVPRGIKLLIKYVNMFLIPILLIIYGIVRWRRITRREEADNE